MLDENLKKTLLEVARFYDRRKVGDTGFLGFRRSTNLTRLATSFDQLISQHILIPQHSIFLDMGCADGRVNVLFSYFVRISIGIEIDEWTLEEYGHLKVDLEAHLQEKRLSLPPDNIFLFHGDSTDYLLHEKIKKDTGISFNDIDLFYTYLTMYDEYAELIASQAKKDSVFMVYGLEKILPTLNGFRLLTPKRSIENILALYQKR